MLDDANMQIQPTIAEEEDENDQHSNRMLNTHQSQRTSVYQRQQKFDYSDFGRSRKSKGFQKFPHQVQPMLYFMKHSKHHRMTMKSSSIQSQASLSPARMTVKQIEQDIQQQQPIGVIKKFTEPDLMFQHRQHKMQMQKAKRTLIDYMQMDR